MTTAALLLLLLCNSLIWKTATGQEYIDIRSSGSSVYFQTRVSTTLICQSICPSYAEPWAIVSFTGSPLQSWTRFTNPLPIYVGSNYIGTSTQLLGGTILMTLQAAGIGGGAFIPTGYSGNVCFDTVDWTPNNIKIGGGGNTFAVTNVLDTQPSAQCNGLFLAANFLCGCYFSVSPTTNPTLAPTQNPTFYQGATQLVKLTKGTQIQLRRAVQYDGPPTRLEVISSGAFQRVRWLNVSWTFLGVLQANITECDPVPNLLPGVPQEGKCPCIEQGCTTAAMSGLGKFTTLRCCIISKVELLLPGGTSLPSNVWVKTASIGDSDNTTTPTTTSLGTIRCNNAIERELNCQFWRQAPQTYQLQCAQAPIDCYRNQTLGYAFGLFWDRNPRFPYTKEPLGEGQLRGVASIINNKVYMKGGKLVDPLGPKLMNDYYWSGSLTPPQEQLWPFRAIVTPEIIQSRPASWFLNLPSEADLDTSPCLMNPLSPLCEWLTWQNLTGPEFKLPGMWLLLEQNTTIWPQEWLVAFPGAGDQGEGVEIWSGAGELLYQNLTRARSWTMPLEHQLPLMIRILLKGQIWDIPAAQLSPSWPLPPDSYWSLVQMGNLQFPMLQLVSAAQREAQGDWPYWNQTWPGVPVVTIKFTLTPQRWDALAELILTENIYPYNHALQAEEHLYDTRPVNLTEDYDYLRLVWTTLARRHPSEDGDCRTVDLGTITYLDDLQGDEYTQIWYQQQEPVGGAVTLIPPGAREGGCRCRALWDPLTACSECLEGLGGVECSIVFGPDPIPGSPPKQCAGHGISIGNSTTRTQLLYLWGGRFTLCESLLLQDQLYDLVPQAGQGSAFLFQQAGGAQIVYLRGQLFLDLEPLETILIQQNPALWETTAGLIECLGTYRKQALMNPPYVIPPIKAVLQI